jgi:hypothetical protein
VVGAVGPDHTHYLTGQALATPRASRPATQRR